MADKKKLRAEIAELRAEVAKLAATQAAHNSGCHCGHVCVQPTVPVWGGFAPTYPLTSPVIVSPYQITCASGTDVAGGYVAAGCGGYNPVVTTFSISN